MLCPKCGSENADQRSFCRECGAMLRIYCRRCGFQNLAGDRFCGGCGARFRPAQPSGGQAAPPPASRAVDGEHYSPDELKELLHGAPAQGQKSVEAKKPAKEVEVSQDLLDNIFEAGGE